jgi:hypothetical protein
VPFVAAHTAAACCYEKQRVILILMPCSTDICAARKPSAVHGYLTYALGTHENISRPWSNISCAIVFASEKTSIDTPASPTNGEIVCAIFLYSSVSSLFESLCPDAISSLMCGSWQSEMGWSSVHRQTPTFPQPAESPAGRYHPPIFSSWVESLECSFPCEPQAYAPLPSPPSTPEQSTWSTSRSLEVPVRGREQHPQRLLRPPFFPLAATS